MLKIRIIVLASLSSLMLSFTILPQDQDNFDWLLGQWQRTNNKPNYITLEHWQKEHHNHYIGMGYTLKSNDTVFKEYMRLFKKGSNWIFEVTGVNEQPTNFELSSITVDGFICQNEQNDFPKRIHYFRNKTKLVAKISGAADEVVFEFKRQE